LELESFATRALMSEEVDKVALYGMVHTLWPILCARAVNGVPYVRSPANPVQVDATTATNDHQPLYFLVLYFAIADVDLGISLYWILEVSKRSQGGGKKVSLFESIYSYYFQLRQ